MILTLILSLAYINTHYLTVNGDDKYFVYDPPYAIESVVGVEATYKMLNTSFLIETRLRPNHIANYAPYYVNYINDFWVNPIKEIKVGYKHSCSHPILSQSFQQENKFYSSENRVYIEGRFSLHE